MRSLQELKTAHYDTLTNKEWHYLSSEGIVNGFGPNSDRILGWILDRISPAFKTADANIHDFTYWQGGNEDQRRKCDDGFFFRLATDSMDMRGWKQFYYLVLSLIYYYAVRLFGSKYFKYK